MTSRKLLWMTLGALGIPLLVEGLGGCGFTAFPAKTIRDNAYNCGCVCGQPTTRRIAASADDVEQAGVTMTLNGMDLDLGAETVGLRFANAMIPAGANVLSARVQFTAAAAGENAATNLGISAELSVNAATFTAANNDLGGRTFTAAPSDVAWPVDPWVAVNDAGPAQQTPAVGPLIQQLVNQAGWTDASAVVLRFAGSGQRSAVSFDASPVRAAVLSVTFASVEATLPICATPDIVAQDDPLGALPQHVAEADCANRVTDTLSGLAGQCGYPAECRCALDIPAEGDPTFDRDVCEQPCTEVPADPTCTNFDPEGFERCFEQTGNQTDCDQFVSATNAPGDAPVCTAAADAPAMPGHVYGNVSRCAVAGTSHIEVGDREPTKDPMTTGIVAIRGDPCPGGGCSVGASFGLAMEPITFSVRFASDPMFSDLSAAGESLSATAVNGVDAVFEEDTVGGTGNGRRGSNGLAVNARNQSPLVLGVDWTAGTCGLTGNLASTVDGEVPDGVCAGDDTVLCTADSPDCDEVGGPCEFEDEDTEPLTVDVALAGTLVNQPPAAAAGPDLTVECTSPAGAEFTLQGAATDPDPNVALVSWREGTRIGPEVGQDLALTQTLGVGAAQTYVLRVIDAFAQADEDAASVAVVDTTPPQLAVSVSPDRLRPPSHRLETITATITASDTCDTAPTIRLVSITSNEPDNGLGDGDQPNDVQGAAFGTDDRQFQLRRERSGNGGGRVYTIIYSATDDSGNTTLERATVTVPH